MSSAAKPRISVVFIGHVDSGKSTTSGHMIYKCGGIDKRTIDKFEKEANDMGKGSFKFAWVFDKNMDERKRGITVNSACADFHTQNNDITIIDAPGHKDFIKNMITGTSQADAAIIVVPASRGEAETAIGPSGQTREHILLANTLGVKQACVLINKMDACEYSQARFDELNKEVMTHMKKVGYSPESTPIIPISGFLGDNLVEPSDKMPWFTGWQYTPKSADKNAKPIKGHTLYDFLNSLNAPARPTDKPLRLTLTDVYRIGGIGVVPAGRIESGIMKPGDIVAFAPAGGSAEVKSIEMHHTQLTQAIPGDSIGFNVKNVSITDVKRGTVVGHAKNDPPKEIETFSAQVVITKQLAKGDGGIVAGYTPMVDVHSAHIPCKFEKIDAKIDKRTGKQMTENDGAQMILRHNESGIVTMRPIKPLCCETFSVYPQLGRFAVRDARSTVAVGVIKSTCKKEAPTKGAAGKEKGGAQAKGGAKGKAK